MTKERQKSIGIDFDGVLHSYVSGYSELPSDPPIPGSQKFCIDLLARGFNIFVFTARISGTNYSEARHAGIANWLQRNGFPYMKVTGEKLAADLYVDDNGFRFKGNFEEVIKGVDSKELLTVWYTKNPGAKTFRDETAQVQS